KTAHGVVDRRHDAGTNTFAPIWVGIPENWDSRVLVKRTVCRELAVGAAANALDACTSGPATTEVKTRSVPIVPAARCSMTPSAGAPQTRQARARPSVAAAPLAPGDVADEGRDRPSACERLLHDLEPVRSGGTIREPRPRASYCTSVYRLASHSSHRRSPG